MKRSPPLLELSREHHTALSLALRARRGADDANDAVVAMTSALMAKRFETDLRPHFQEEEAWLLPALARAGEDALVARTLAEHGELTALVAALATPDREALRAFAAALVAHVRFEERELFPAAEKHPDCLPPAAP